MRICDVEGCGKKHFGHGYCVTHHRRWRRHGSPDERPRYDHVADRIAAKLERHGECLLYTGGHPSNSGQRLIRNGGNPRGVHRVAWEIVYGPIPPGMCVCHRCDVPNCVNVPHLFLGTVGDNNLDRDRKGRTARAFGSRNANAKLTEWSVIQIRSALGEGQTPPAIARRFGVSAATIRLIKKRRIWSQVQ